MKKIPKWYLASSQNAKMLPADMMQQPINRFVQIIERFLKVKKINVTLRGSVNANHYTL